MGEQWRNGKHDMDNTMVVRMQLEALARCVHDVYRRAPETMFAAGDAEERDARVDIDLAVRTFQRERERERERESARSHPLTAGGSRGPADAIPLRRTTGVAQGGRLLVAYQTLAAGTGVVTAEHDDTAAALVALQSAEVLER
jgi:hypothetical protein